MMIMIANNSKSSIYTNSCTAEGRYEIRPSRITDYRLSETRSISVGEMYSTICV